MSLEKRIDDLIETGWHVLESNFDEATFQKWKKQAADCVNALLGPDHPYTEYFKADIRQAEQKNLLAVTGILSAVREEILKEKPQASRVGTRISVARKVRNHIEPE